MSEHEKGFAAPEDQQKFPGAALLGKTSVKMPAWGTLVAPQQFWLCKASLGPSSSCGWGARLPWDTKAVPPFSVAQDNYYTLYSTSWTLSEASETMQTHPTALSLLQSCNKKSRKRHVSGHQVGRCRNRTGSKSAGKEMSLAEGGAVFDSNTGFSLALCAPMRHAELQEELPQLKT